LGQGEKSRVSDGSTLTPALSLEGRGSSRIGPGHEPPAEFVHRVPSVEPRGVRIRADLRDLDADGTVVRFAGVPGALLQVERLIDRAIHVEHEVRRQAADVVQHLEAAPR